MEEAEAMLEWGEQQSKRKGQCRNDSESVINAVSSSYFLGGAGAGERGMGKGGMYVPLAQAVAEYRRRGAASVGAAEMGGGGMHMPQRLARGQMRGVVVGRVRWGRRRDGWWLRRGGGVGSQRGGKAEGGGEIQWVE